MKYSYWHKFMECCRRKLACMRLKHFVLFYISIVLVFAFINQGIFWKDSTTFAISDQMNKHVERYELLGPKIDLVKFHENAKDKMPITFERFYVKILPDVKRLEYVYSQLDTTQQELDSCKKELSRVTQLADVERKASIEAFIDRTMKGYQLRIDSLRRYMIGKDTTELIIKGKYVELARLRRDYAKKNAEVYKNILEHYGSFIPDSLAIILTNLNNEDIKLSFKYEELENSRRSVSRRIKETARAFHNNRYETVTFLDFIYYSVCVSTTVSFGDIVPNSTSARLAAIIELFFCLILLGLILEKVKMIVINQKRNINGN